MREREREGKRESSFPCPPDGKTIFQEMPSSSSQPGTGVSDARRTGKEEGLPFPRSPSLTRSSSAGSAASAIRGHKSLEREEKAARKLPLGEIPAATRRQRREREEAEGRDEEREAGVFWL